MESQIAKDFSGLGDQQDGKQMQSQQPLDSTEGDSTFNICDLPAIVKLKIFSFLNTEMLCRIGKVCLEWHELTKESVFWKRMEFITMKLPTERALELLKNKGSIVMTLHLLYRNDQTKILQQVCKTCSKLKTLTLMEQEAELAYITVAQKCPEIENLTICFRKDILPCKRDFQFLACFRKLNTLTLVNYWYVKYIKSELVWCELNNLTAIHFSEVALRDDDMCFIVENLKDQLLTLSFLKSQLAYQALMGCGAEMYYTISKCYKLQELNVSVLKGSECSEILLMAETLTNLRFLYVRVSKLDSLGPVFILFSKLPQLERLQVTGHVNSKPNPDQYAKPKPPDMLINWEITKDLKATDLQLMITEWIIRKPLGHEGFSSLCNDKALFLKTIDVIRDQLPHAVLRHRIGFMFQDNCPPLFRSEWIHLKEICLSSQ